MFLMLLTAYGLCFFLMNKATFLYNRVAFFDKMFQCAFCTGFHTGWISFVLHTLVIKGSVLSNWQDFLSAILFGFASACTSYLLDNLGQVLEAYIHQEE